MIWFDLDNSPHVPLFNPILKELDKNDEKYIVTSRDFAQTQELLDLYGIKNLRIGNHAGRSKIKKILNLISRALKLRNKICKYDTSLAVSHGSRTQVLASYLMGIPSLWMMDYEYTEHFLFNKFCKYILAPKLIPDNILENAGINLNKVIKYDGFKEEIYLNGFKPNPEFRNKLNVREDEIFIVLRPPSMSANYHNSSSEKYLIYLIDKILRTPNTNLLIVNRTGLEKEFLVKHFSEKKLNFLNEAVDGLQLIYSSDIFVSGGGTMNREAALLGTKTYSIFSGKKPYLDLYLEEQGKLKFIRNLKDIDDLEIRKYNKSFVEIKNDLAKEISNIFIQLKGGHHESPVLESEATV